MSRHRKAKEKEKEIENDEAANELLRADVLRYMRVKRSELKLEDKLGNGSYGDIHRARLFGMNVAVKAIKSGLADDDFEDFQREVQLLTSMNHPHIVQAIGAVVGDGTCDNPPLLILELCERGSLDNYVRGRPRLSVATVIQISLGIANGLNYLHHRGIIHRDIKSGNILLSKYLQPKIADFGLCHVTEGKKLRGSFGEVGTPSFMAPEVLRNEVYGTSCDVFSFGMIICEMLCGHYPFKVASRAHVSNTNDFSEDILKGQRPDMPDDANPELVALINQCWQDEPDQRPNMDEVIVTLERIRDALPARPATRANDDRNVEEWPEEATRQLTERKKQIGELMTKQRSLMKELSKARRGHAKAVKSVGELDEEIVALRRQLGLPTERSSHDANTSQASVDHSSSDDNSGSGDDDNSNDNDDEEEGDDDDEDDKDGSDDEEEEEEEEEEETEENKETSSSNSNGGKKQEKKMFYRSPRVRQLRSRAVPAGTPISSATTATTAPTTTNRRTPASRTSRTDSKRTSPTTIDTSSATPATTVEITTTARRGRSRVTASKDDSNKSSDPTNNDKNNDTHHGDDDGENKENLPLITPKLRTRATRRRATDSDGDHDTSSKKVNQFSSSPSSDRSLFTLRRVSPSTLSALASGKKPRRSDSPMTTPSAKPMNIHATNGAGEEKDTEYDNITPHILSHTVRATRSRPALQPLTNLVTPTISRVIANRKRTRSATPAVTVTSSICEEEHDDDDNDNNENDDRTNHGHGSDDDNNESAPKGKRPVTRRSSRVTNRTKRHRSEA